MKKTTQIKIKTPNSIQADMYTANFLEQLYIDYSKRLFFRPSIKDMLTLAEVVSEKKASLWKKIYKLFPETRGISCTANAMYIHSRE